jgi:uncharacterized SAM-binding protein YcdF (DUF218 family)
MSWNFIITNWVSAFLMPPLGLIVLFAIGFLLRKKWRRLGTWLSVASLFMLVLLSTSMGALLLIQPLEQLSPPLKSAHNSGAQAIVVLGGGQVQDAPEYGGMNIPNAITLMRLRYASKLYLDTGLPILVSGGTVGASQSEAALMARVLREDFSTPVKWLEESSENTAQNAQFSARILQPVCVQRILLVTDAMHMARAQRIFARNGFDVVMAPTQFISYSHQQFSPMDLIPEYQALYRASYALHEWIGLAWYWLRY